MGFPFLSAFSRFPCCSLQNAVLRCALVIIFKTRREARVVLVSPLDI